MSAPISLYLFIFHACLYFPHLFPISLGFPTLSLGCQALGKGVSAPPLPTSAPGRSSSRNRKAGIPQGRPRADTATSVSKASENVTREPPGATGHSPTRLDQPLRARDGGGETERLPRAGCSSQAASSLRSSLGDAHGLWVPRRGLKGRAVELEGSRVCPGGGAWAVLFRVFRA